MLALLRWPTKITNTNLNFPLLRYINWLCDGASLICGSKFLEDSIKDYCAFRARSVVELLRRLGHRMTFSPRKGDEEVLSHFAPGAEKVTDKTDQWKIMEKGQNLLDRPVERFDTIWLHSYLSSQQYSDRRLNI